MTPNDVKIVADNIDDFIEVPDGVERLRKAVLVLAASGKLVPQDPKEGSAEKFYAQIQSDREKTGNGATGRSRKIHDFPPLTQKEIPYQIPSSWKWVRLGEIIEFRVGKTPPRNDPQYWSDAKVPWVSIADLNAGGTVVTTKESINELALEKVFGGYIAPKGTLLFSFKLTIGKMSVLGVDACHNEAIAAFFTLNDTLRDYLFKILPAINTTGRTSNAIKGKTLNSETIALIEIPLPPLSEQKRIVAKVQEVMKQLDELEAKKRERDGVRTRFARSAMQSLGKGESKIPFEHLADLVKTPEDIEELEKALRMLAVFGHLTSNPIEVDVPASWKWMKWGDVLSDEKYSMKRGPFGSALRKDYFVPDGVMVYEQYNAIHDVDRARYFISDEKYKELEAFTVRPGDLIISCSGTLGRIAELHANSRVGIINQALLKIKLNGKVVLNDYFILLFRSDFIQDRIYLEALGTAMTNMVNVKTLKTILLPIPPISEQKRIVKKVEEVMGQINRLKQVIG